MAGVQDRRVEGLKARHRRILRGGFLVSLLFHLFLFLTSRGVRVPDSPFSAAGPRAGDDRAAPLGGGIEVVNLRAASPREEVPRPPAPIPVPVPDVTVEVEELLEPVVASIDFSRLPGAVGPEVGPDPGAGIEGGEGKGDGGTADEGRFRVLPPTPRGLILPPADRPGEVRGKEVAVWVFVDVQGRVVADSTRLVPGTGDSDFDRRLRRQAAEWVFEPARKKGTAVAEWFRYVVVL